MFDFSQKTGCHPDAALPGEARWNDHPLVGAPASVSSASIERPDVWPDVFEQIAQNCCGHGLGGSTYATAAANGQRFDDWVSTLWLYAVAIMTASPLSPLKDEGSSLRAMIRGASDRSLLATTVNSEPCEGWGIVAESDFPELPSNVNRVPPDDVWIEGEGATIRSYSAIPDGDPNADELVESAIRRRRFPTGCCWVGPRLENLVGNEIYKGEDHEGPNAPGGNHCMVFSGAYSATLDAFEMRNSWGRQRGNLGYVWVAREFVRARMFGRLIVEIAPPQLQRSR